MMERYLRSVLAPWSGLLVGAAAWFLHHQAGSDSNMGPCGHETGGGFILLIGLACAALTAGGGYLSWRTPRLEDPDPSPYRPFARAVGLGSAGLFLLAITFQILAGLTVPACLR